VPGLTEETGRWSTPQDAAITGAKGRDKRPGFDAMLRDATRRRFDVLIWLTLVLRRRGLPVVCLDARHAKAALSLQVNKTDANDTLGLAQAVRAGWFREVAIKSMDAQTLRMLLMALAQLVSQRQAVANNIRGLLKTFGHVIARGCKGPFPIRVRNAVGDNQALSAIIEPLLTACLAIRDQV
jgi:transposase